jgi:hypothetical protein
MLVHPTRVEATPGLARGPKITKMAYFRDQRGRNREAIAPIRMHDMAEYASLFHPTGSIQ